MLNGGHDSVDIPTLRHDVVQDKMKLYFLTVYYGSSDYDFLRHPSRVAERDAVVTPTP